MAVNPYWTTPVRHPEDVGVQYLRRTVTLAMLTAGVVPIGALEAGAQPLGCDIAIITAFDAVTTNVLTVGTVDDDDGYAQNAGAAAGTAGFKQNLAGALSGIPLAADKVVYAKYSQTGTAATVGVAVITLKFAVKREGEGTAWPNN